MRRRCPLLARRPDLPDLPDYPPLGCSPVGELSV